MSLAAGMRLGQYELLGQIGAGGMGEVYKAKDTRLGREVAIKVLPVDHLADEGRRRRFVQEAQAASALNHPHIITIHEIETVEDRDFIVMEYVRGKSLDAAIARRGMRLGETLRIAIAVADALAVAHAQGIIHRDLKPGNVIVGTDGAVKVLDFGLAKLTRDDKLSAAETATASADPVLSVQGTVVGTAAYMSPEQATAGTVDARTDIFSFGAMLYEMVTGRRAFGGTSIADTLSAVIRVEPTRPTAIVPAVPGDLEKVILRCLRKDLHRRFQHIADVKVALQDIKEELESAQQRQLRMARTYSWRRWTFAALLGLVALAGLFAWQVSRITHPEEPRAVPLTTFPGIESYPSLSPDGNNVAFMWTGPKQDNPDIYVQVIGSSGPPLSLTTNLRADYNPVWSPDNRWIAFLRAEQLPGASSPVGKAEVWLIPPLGGPERRVAKIQLRAIGSPGFLAWDPNSRFLVVADSPGEGKPDALFAISLDTEEKYQLTNPTAPLLGDSNPSISPDGRWLVFRRVAGAGGGELYRLPLGTDLKAAGEPVRLTSAALDAAHPAWLPNGTEILFSATQPRSLWRLPISGEKPPARLPFVGENGVMPVVSRAQATGSARLVYARSFADVNIWRVDTSALGGPTSAPPTMAISSTHADIVGDFSPDRQRVAFGSSRSGGSIQIWLADADGSNAVPLTSITSGIAAAPRWSPNGRMIAFQSNLEGQFDIYTIPAAGGKLRRITSDPANDHVPTFSRDGEWIYFSSNRTGDYQVWKVSASGGEATQVTRRGGFLAFEETDGPYLYYTQTPASSPTPLWRLSTAGGEPVKVLDGVISTAFAVMKTGIYYVDRASSEARLQFLDFTTGSSTTVAHNLGDIRPLLAVSPDGRTILYTRQDSSVNDLMLVENFR